jgi:ferredoxin
MKAAVVYFSGTGNTYRVGELFKTYLEDLNYQVDMVDITKSDNALKNYDLFIAGTPTQNAVSTFNLNEFIRRYISKKDNPKASFITYVTHSWGIAYGHLTIRDFVQKRGFKVMGARAFQAPNNFYMFRKEHPKFNNERFNAALESINQMVKEIIDAFVTGNVIIDKRSEYRKTMKYLFAKANKATMLSRLAKLMMKVDHDKCTGCGVCVKKCSNGNIKLTDGKIEFQKQCVACARCMHVCPKNAYLLNGEAFEQYEGIRKPIKEIIQA